MIYDRLNLILSAALPYFFAVFAFTQTAREEITEMQKKVFTFEKESKFCFLQLCVLSFAPHTGASTSLHDRSLNEAAASELLMDSRQILLGFLIGF